MHRYKSRVWQRKYFMFHDLSQLSLGKYIWYFFGRNWILLVNYDVCSIRLLVFVFY